MMTDPEALSLIARTFPAVWSDLWAGRKTPRAFQLASLAKPRTYFLGAKELEHLVPGLAGLCPLIERNGEAIIGWLPKTDRFVQVHYEDGREADAAIEVLGRNYQQCLLALCLEFEDAGLRDEWLEFAAATEFAHADELADALDRKAIKNSREQLLAIVDEWALARRIETFFEDAAARAATLDQEMRGTTLARLERARQIPRRNQLSRPFRVVALAGAARARAADRTVGRRSSA